MQNRKSWDPMPHQLYALERLGEMKSHALWLQMSLGKTSIVLTHIQNRVKYLTKTLVIAPPLVARTVWPAEAWKWKHLEGLKVEVVSGDADTRLHLLGGDSDVYCISRNHIQWLVEQYIRWTGKGKSRRWQWRKDKVWPFGLVVLDEAANFKDPDGVWFKYLARLRRLNVDFINLTGTPAPNGLLDIWAQTYLLDGGAALGSSMTAYKASHFRPVEFRDTPRGLVASKWSAINPATIYEALTGLTTSMRTVDWAELPEVSYRTSETHIPMREYRTLKRDGVLRVGHHRISCGNGGVLGQKLLQVANGACYDDDKAVVFFHDAKLDMLEARIEEADTPVIVFTAFQHDKARVLAHFKKARQVEGAETIEQWNNREIAMLVAHPEEIGHGLNLQYGGRHIIWFGLTYALGDYQQGNSRLIRVGQDGPVTVDHIVASGTVDERILPVLLDKDATQDDLMQALSYAEKED